MVVGSTHQGGSSVCEATFLRRLHPLLLKVRTSLLVGLHGSRIIGLWFEERAIRSVTPSIVSSGHTVSVQIRVSYTVDTHVLMH